MDARMVKSARLVTYKDLGLEPEEPTSPLSEEGEMGDECPMTGDKMWKCPCPECEKKRRESEEGTDEPVDLSVEEELMRLTKAREDGIKKAAEMKAAAAAKARVAREAELPQKAILALAALSETLDKAGLHKSAYAALRTLQVLQKEIK
jgi:hypothetical protein